ILPDGFKTASADNTVVEDQLWFRINGSAPTSGFNPYPELPDPLSFSGLNEDPDPTRPSFSFAMLSNEGAVTAPRTITNWQAASCESNQTPNPLTMPTRGI